MSATKNPVIRELNGDAARERKEKQAQIISRPKEESSARKTSENPSAAERVGKTVTGAGKGSAAGFTNLGGVVVEGLNKVGT